MVVLQEATRPDVVRALAKETGLGEHGSHRGQSLGFLSRLAVAQSVWRRPLLSRHAFLELTLAGHDVHIVGVHLSAVHAAWTERRRLIELASLLRTVRARQPGFHVLAGDFNTIAPGEALDVARLPPRLRPLVWLSGGSIRWKTVAAVLAAGYADAWRRLHGDDAGSTFPTWDPHLRLDYVFAPGAHVESHHPMRRRHVGRGRGGVGPPAAARRARVGAGGGLIRPAGQRSQKAGGSMPSARR